MEKEMVTEEIDGKFYTNVEPEGSWLEQSDFVDLGTIGGRVEVTAPVEAPLVEPFLTPYAQTILGALVVTGKHVYGGISNKERQKRRARGKRQRSARKNNR